MAFRQNIVDLIKRDIDSMNLLSESIDHSKIPYLSRVSVFEAEASLSNGSVKNGQQSNQKSNSLEFFIDKSFNIICKDNENPIDSDKDHSIKKLSNNNLEYLDIKVYVKKVNRSDYLKEKTNKFTVETSEYLLDHYVLIKIVKNIRDSSNAIINKKILLKRNREENPKDSSIDNRKRKRCFSIGTLENEQKNLGSRLYNRIRSESKSNAMHSTTDTTDTKDTTIINWKEMVSASQTRNYFLDDGILDFLNYYSKNPNEHSLIFNQIIGSNEENNLVVNNTRSKNRSNEIMKKSFSKDDLISRVLQDEGIKFEEHIIKQIEAKAKSDIFGISFVKIAESYQARDLKKFEYTKKCINMGKHILYQPVLYNLDDNTFGCPDLIIRSDIINRFFGGEYVNSALLNRFTEEIAKNSEGTLKNKDYFYIVIDIKHSNLEFNSDLRTLRNTDTIKPYKGQLCVYNNAISKIQNFDPKISLILGKSYTSDKSKTKVSCYNINELNSLKLGIVDYSDKDFSYVDKTKKAVEWIRRIRTEGRYWVLSPIPSVRELFPRMNNEKDSNWRSVKERISNEIGEITSVYYCGTKERNNAHDRNIFSWKDENCNSTMLGFKENKRKSNNNKISIGETVDKILDINRSSENIHPRQITLDEIDGKNWRTINDNSVEFYLDFETLNSNFDCSFTDMVEGNGFVSNFSGNVFIFQIGVGYDLDGKWVYKSFISSTKTAEGEKNMIVEFLKYTNDVQKKLNKQQKHFVHWYPHEVICYQKLRSKLACTPDSTNIENISFLDLSELFKREPIVVKGALRFKLKTISKALYKLGLISTSWDSNNECSSGLVAMALANDIYKNNKVVTEEIESMKKIIYYNEIDCKVLWDILKYLRTNH